MADDNTTDSGLIVPGDKTGDFIKKSQIRKGSYPDGSITTPKLADGLITTAKLADSSITSAKILDGTIATADLADSSVTSGKLALDQRQVIFGNPIYNSAFSGGIVSGTYTFAQRANILISWGCTGYLSSGAGLATAYWGLSGISYYSASQLYFNYALMHMTFPTSYWNMTIAAGTYTFLIYASNFSTDSNDRGYLSFVGYYY